ncbi:MAG: FGGY family carbohydrate kinase [Nocardioides sp.]
MTFILAIDQGTSGTKALVIDEAGGVRSLAEVPLRPRYLPGGAVEQNAEALFRSVLSAGRRAVAEAGVPVAAVALANQGETVLAWDRATGRPLSAAIVWQDRRAEAVCAARAGHAARVAELSGLVLDPYFTAPKIRWLRDEVTTQGVVTTTDTWIAHRLCGAFVTDISTASRSLILDLDQGSWSTELLGVFDLGTEDLPEIVACDQVVGETDLFGGRIPVAGLIVDQQAALLAQACLDAGTAKCTFGTGAFLLAQLGERPIRSTAGLTTSVAWRLRQDTSYCVDGQVYTAASAVRWATQLGLVPSADRLDEVAEASSDGVICVPALAGLAAPWWQSGATASFTGMSLSSTRGHLTRALLEGIAAQVATLISVVAADLGEPLSRLRADGGLTRSRTLMQAQADLTQIPVDVYPSAHATPLGAATCARLAIDAELRVEQAVPRWDPEHTYEPQWSADQAAEHLDRWQTTAEALSPRAAR